jgi:hypothetical protein
MAVIRLGKWSSLSEVATYLSARTGDGWTSSAVLSRLRELSPEKAVVLIRSATPLLQFVSGEWREITLGNPKLFEINEGADTFLSELEIGGTAMPTDLSSSGIEFRVLFAIKMDDVRLSETDAEWLLTAADRAWERLNFEANVGNYAVPETIAIFEDLIRREEHAPVLDTDANFRTDSKMSDSDRPVQANIEGKQATASAISTKVGKTDDEKDDWKSKVRELAQEIGEKKWRAGTRQITARGMAEPVAIRLGTILKEDGRGRFWGVQGARSASNVRIKALNGWKFYPPKDVD